MSCSCLGPLPWWEGLTQNGPPNGGPSQLFDYLGNDARADGSPALSNGEPEALIHGDRLNELDLHLGVLTRCHELAAVGELDDACDVSRAEVELRPIAGDERRVTTALLLLQAVDLRLVLRMRGDRAGLAEHLPALDLLALGASEQRADVVAGAALVEDLAKHLDAGDHGLGGVRDADDLDLVTGVDDALLDAAGRDGAAAGDREDVLDRHQERLVKVTLGLRDVLVERGGQVDDRLLGLLVALERLQRRALDDRHVGSGELVLGEQVADLFLDELQELCVRLVDHVDLVQVDDHVGDVHLARQQDVLARLRHRAVGRRNHQDRAVHLGGAGDHVLDVVGVTRAVDVRVVTVVRLVLDVRGRDRDAALALLGGVVDLLEGARLAAIGLTEHLGDGRSQRGLSMVDMTDGPYVDVRLVPLELLLRHLRLLLSKTEP